MLSFLSRWSRVRLARVVPELATVDDGMVQLWLTR